MDWQDYDWGDVEPVQDPVSGQLAAIAYDAEYKEAMAYLRALLQTREASERALALTQAVIAANPAHYSVWDYRLDIVTQIGNDVYDYKTLGLVKGTKPPVGEDGEWLNELTLDIPKNYQIWNYRQHLEMPDCAEYYRGEVVAVRFVLDDDAKNFHAWSHLKWAVTASLKRAPLAAEPLVEYVDELLDKDVYNNSCWSFRFFLLSTFPALVAAWDEEVQFVAEQIERAPDNEAAWSYARGIFETFQPARMEQLKALAQSYDTPRALEIAGELGTAAERSTVAAKLTAAEPFRAAYWQHKFAA